MSELIETPADALRVLAEMGVQKAESTMLGMEQADCPVVHRFGPGVYIRELHMRAGTLAIGHHQRYDHVNVLVKGKVQMLGVDGSMVEVSAPATFVGKPGRKMGYVVEDTVWQNVYATELTDIYALEKHFLDKSVAWNADEQATRRVQRLSKQGDRDDFTFLLASYGFLPEVVRQQSEETSDQIPMPLGAWAFKIDNSPIEGKGVFLTAGADAGFVVGPARIQGKRTPLGRYTNHSVDPNARMVLLPNGDVNLVLLRDVFGCRGGTNGEEVTIDYRQALRMQGILEGEFK